MTEKEPRRDILRSGEHFRRRVICVDLDGTLADGVSWTPEECLGAKPNEELIEQINELYEENFIVLYTARRDHLIPATLEWCRRNNVQWHAWSNKKIGAEYYLDDRSLRPEEVWKI